MSRESNGYKWSFLNVAMKSIAQLMYTAVISRLLGENEFGIIATANLVINFGAYFAKLGLGPAIIQKKDISDEEIDAAFTSSLVLGMVSCIIFLIAAPLIGMFFDNTKVVSIIRVLSLSFIFSGLSITPMALLSRHIKFKEIARIEISAYVIGNMFIGIICAYLGLKEWSLVAATLSQQLVIGIGSIIISKHRYKFTFKKENYVGIYSYGIKSTANNILDYFVSNIEKFFIGKMDQSGLGQYNRTTSIIVNPIEQITFSLSRVFFPQISKVQEDKKKLKEIYSSYYILFTTIICSIGLGVLAGSNNIIRVILGSNWTKIEPIFIIVTIATVFSYITHYNAVLCDATAMLLSKFKIQSFNLTFIVVASFLFYKKGTFAILVIMLISKIIKFIMYQINTSKILEISFKENIIMFFNILKSSLIPAILILIPRVLMNSQGINAFIILAIQICLGAIGLVIGILILPIDNLISKIKDKIRIRRKAVF